MKIASGKLLSAASTGNSLWYKVEEISFCLKRERKGSRGATLMVMGLIPTMMEILMRFFRQGAADKNGWNLLLCL